MRSLVAAALLRREQRATTSLSRATELLSALASLEWEALSPLGADTSACAAAADGEDTDALLKALQGSSPVETRALLGPFVSPAEAQVDAPPHSPPHLLQPWGVHHEVLSVTLPALPAAGSTPRPSASSASSCVPTAQAVLVARQRESSKRPLGVALVPATAHVPLHPSPAGRRSSDDTGAGTGNAGGALTPVPAWLAASTSAFSAARAAVALRREQGQTSAVHGGKKRPRGVLGGVSSSSSAQVGSAAASVVLGHMVGTAGHQRHALAAAVVGLELEQASREAAPVSRGDVFYSMSAAFRLGDCGTALATGLADQEVRGDALLARSTPAEEEAAPAAAPTKAAGPAATVPVEASSSASTAVPAAQGAAGAAGNGAESALGVESALGAEAPPAGGVQVGGGGGPVDSAHDAQVDGEEGVEGGSDDDEGGGGSGTLPPGVAFIGCARDMPELGVLPMGSPFSTSVTTPAAWSHATSPQRGDAAAPGWPSVDSGTRGDTGSDADAPLACLPGVRVTTIIAGSQAGLGGQLRPNDVIVGIHVQGVQVWGAAVSPPADLWSVSVVSRILSAARADGQHVRLEVARPVPLLLLESVVRGRTPDSALRSVWAAQRSAGAERNLWLSSPGDTPPCTPPPGTDSATSPTGDGAAVQRTGAPVHPHVALQDSELGAWLRSQLGVCPGLNIPLADMSPPSPPWLMLAAHTPTYAPSAAHMLTPAPRGAHEPEFPQGVLGGGKPGSQPARHLHAARVMHHLQHAPQGGEWQRRYQLVVSQRGVMPLPVQLLANVALYGTPFANVHFNRVMPLFSIPAVAEGVFNGGHLGVGSYSMAQLGTRVLGQLFPFAVPESNMLEHLDSLIRSLRTQSTWNGIAASARDTSSRQDPMDSVPGYSWSRRADAAHFTQVALRSLAGQVQPVQLKQLLAAAAQADLAAATEQNAAHRVMPPLLGERAAPVRGHWNVHGAAMPWLGAVAVAVEAAQVSEGGSVDDDTPPSKQPRTAANVWAALLLRSVQDMYCQRPSHPAAVPVTRPLLTLPPPADMGGGAAPPNQKAAP